jgi:single-strand DNA-binding protein
MSSIAKVTIVGNLGRDAELKYTPKGFAVLEFTIAVNDRTGGGGGEGGGAPESTTWFRVSLWGKQGETLKQYLVRGKQVMVDGRLRSREYTDRDGKTRTSLEVRADNVLLLGSRGGSMDESGASRPPELERDDEGVADGDIPF